jgi:prevent-host-death family protein
MTITTMTSREFNQHASDAKKAALWGPVFITDRGRPAHVLLSIEKYRRLTGTPENIADLLEAAQGTEDVEL